MPATTEINSTFVLEKNQNSNKSYTVISELFHTEKKQTSELFHLKIKHGLPPRIVNILPEILLPQKEEKRKIRVG